MLHSAAQRQIWKHHASNPPAAVYSPHAACRSILTSQYSKSQTQSQIAAWGRPQRRSFTLRGPQLFRRPAGRDSTPGEDVFDMSAEVGAALQPGVQAPLILTSVDPLPNISSADSPMHFAPSPSLPGESWRSKSSPSLANTPWQVLPSQPTSTWVPPPAPPSKPLTNSTPTLPSEPPSTPSPPSPVTRGSYSDYYRTQHNSSATEPDEPSAPIPPLNSQPPSPDATLTSRINRPPLQDPWSTPPGGATPSAAASPKAPLPDSEVASAMARAHAALAKAESSLDSIESLQSASPPGPFEESLSRAKAFGLVVAVALAMLGCHAFGLGWQWLGATAGGVSGAIAAAFVGAGTLGCSLRFGATLLAFFFSSSKLTKYKGELKEALDDSSKKGGQRDWVQVMCNGLVPTLLSISYGVLAGCVDVPLGLNPSMELWKAQGVTALMGAFLGYYSCCCGDTWASELGPLSTDTPRLITTGRPVRKGTNGGVTLLGTSASIFGGMAMGLVFYLAGLASPTLWVNSYHDVALTQWRLIPLGLMAGLFGSLLDSLLGATLQYSGYNRVTQRVTQTAGPDVTHISGRAVLDNNAVNLCSASITAALTAAVALKMFGC
ncbi:MAG: hypothetical protein WDW38_002796 [Sanguina aurantia]